MKINWKARWKNPMFISQVFLAIVLPILAYFGLTLEDLTTWSTFGNVMVDAISNPYVVLTVIVSLWNAVNDPLTSGVGDSTSGLKYTQPKKEKNKI